MPAKKTSRILSATFLAASVALVISCTAQTAPASAPPELTQPATTENASPSPTPSPEAPEPTDSYMLETENGSASFTVPVEGSSTLAGYWDNPEQTIWYNSYTYIPEEDNRTTPWQVHFLENRGIQEGACQKAEETILLQTTPVITGFQQVDQQNPAIYRWVQSSDESWTAHLTLGVPAQDCPATHGIKTPTGEIAFHLQGTEKQTIPGKSLPVYPAYLTFPTKEEALIWMAGEEADFIAEMLSSLELHGVPATTGASN